MSSVDEFGFSSQEFKGIHEQPMNGLKSIMLWGPQKIISIAGGSLKYFN